MIEDVVERSRDYLHIQLLATDPAIFPYIADDYHPHPDKWKPIESDFVVYLVARDRARPEEFGFGFGAFVPRTWSCYEAHFGFLPDRLWRAATAFRAMLAWVFANTKAARIVGEVAIENRRAIAFVKRAGFSEYGLNPKSWLKNGILRDRVCLGISRPGETL